MDEPIRAPGEFLNIRAEVIAKLGYPNEWRPLLIAVDGRDGAGKSFASWLAWQLDTPAIHLDVYAFPETPIHWRIDELRNVINARIGNERPVIVEGVLVLKALQQANLKSDFLVFVENATSDGSLRLEREISDYLSEHYSKRTPDRTLRWSIERCHATVS